jgi:hypothetical protein
MKTFYLIKSFLPFLFLPIAPGLVQVELERQGLLVHGSNAAAATLILQVIFTLGVVAWLAYIVKRKKQATEFLRMSCVSKKVFHQGRWMSVEQYLADFHNITVSHGMTPEESDNWMRESEEWLRNSALQDEKKSEPMPTRDLAFAK